MQKIQKLQELLFVVQIVVLSLRSSIYGIYCIWFTHCIVVSSVEHQIGAQLRLWKYWIVGEQSIHCTQCAAVMSKMYLHSNDCVDVDHMRTCAEFH